MAGSLIVKTVGSIRERLAGRHVGDPLACGENLSLSMELPDRELGPCEGFLVRGSNALIPIERIKMPKRRDELG